MHTITRCEVENLVRDSAPGNRTFQVKSVSPYIEALTVGSDGCERMEFLGDAVLSVAVTQYLYERFPASREGFLSKMRSKIVSARMLSQLGINLDLEAHVSDTRHGHGHTKVAVDDILEALIAAISLDLGMEAAKAWFINVLEHHVDISALVSWHDSSKQRLSKLSGAVIFSEMASPRGAVSVCVKDCAGVILGTATAATRKDAEEEAARKALTAMHGHGGAAVLPRQAMACHGRLLTVSCG